MGKVKIPDCCGKIQTVGDLRKALEQVPDNTPICSGAGFAQYAIDTVEYDRKIGVVKLLTDELFDYRKLRKVLFESCGGKVKTFIAPGEKNPCGCGSNCFHYEYDGKHIYGVCNACDSDIYEVKEDSINEYLSKGNWKVPQWRVAQK